MTTLTLHERAKLPRSAFAVPSRRAFPVHDAAHARAALRLIRYAHSAYEKANIRRRAEAVLRREEHQR